MIIKMPNGIFVETETTNVKNMMINFNTKVPLIIPARIIYWNTIDDKYYYFYNTQISPSEYIFTANNLTIDFSRREDLIWATANILFDDNNGSILPFIQTYNVQTIDVDILDTISNYQIVHNFISWYSNENSFLFRQHFRNILWEKYIVKIHPPSYTGSIKDLEYDKLAGIIISELISIKQLKNTNFSLIELFKIIGMEDIDMDKTIIPSLRKFL